MKARQLLAWATGTLGVLVAAMTVHSQMVLPSILQESHEDCQRQLDRHFERDHRQLRGEIIGRLERLERKVDALK